MNDEQKELYIAWLRDAHAMEEGLITTLQKQIKETEDQPDMQAKLKEHLEETERHSELVSTCLERLDADTSGGKDFLGKVTAAVNGLGMSMMSDKMVKNVHSSYAAEHFEIATYTTIRAAAEDLDDTETAAVCDEILADEEEMADWLLEQLPAIVTEHVQSLTQP